MVKDIIKDEEFLKIPSSPATLEDISVGTDLLDTLIANKETCVGLAANMIGISKCIIAVKIMDTKKEESLLLFNPKVVIAEKPYETEEGCLSLQGQRPTKRFETIKVEYQNEKLQTRLKKFHGFTAQIIQHEIDHCHGIII